MAIPKFDLFLHPFMKGISDKQEHTLKDLCEYCAHEFNLSTEDRTETIKSGGQYKLYNRVSWASNYLRKAGLICSVKKGIYTITDEGIKALSEGLTINISYLKRYPSFVEFYSSSSLTSYNTQPDDTAYETNDQQTPMEMIDNAINQLNSSLADDLLIEVLKVSPWDFEKLVVKLLIKMGYGDLQKNEDAVTPKSGDEGIDGIVSSDEFGFDSVYIQAKKWKSDSVVGRPEIMKFMGALAGQGATKGLFITTAKFSKEAIEYANKQLQHKIVLVDGKKLTELMIKFNLGVSVSNIVEIKKIDFDFFADGT